MPARPLQPVANCDGEVCIAFLELRWSLRPIHAGQVNYAASKAGLIGFCKALAREVASRQVTVNVVAPGLIETDMTKAMSEDARTALYNLIPLGRLGTPEDVANVVTFLASDRAAYITGQVLVVDGGMVM